MIQNYYQNKGPVANCNTRYVITYSGMGVKFKTDIDATQKNEAKELFAKYYPLAMLISIRKKRRQY